MSREFVELTKGTYYLSAALTFLGGILVWLAARFLLPYLPAIMFAILLGTVVLTVAAFYDDIRHFIEGKPSLLGLMLDLWFGEGTALRLSNRIRELGQVIQWTFKSWDNWAEAIGKVDRALANLFNTMTGWAWDELKLMVSDFARIFGAAGGGGPGSQWNYQPAPAPLPDWSRQGGPGPYRGGQPGPWTREPVKVEVNNLIYGNVDKDVYTIMIDTSGKSIKKSMEGKR
ncbi:MAG: hypothetical protein JRD89_09220 [Deltaproteobacteria bacterium]|nr:hypothetical protein [Deltaproteobacteria bacterium]